MTTGVETVAGLKTFANLGAWLWKAGGWYYRRLSGRPIVSVERPADIGRLVFSGQLLPGDLVEGKARLSRFAPLYHPVERFVYLDDIETRFRSDTPVGSLPAIDESRRVYFLYGADTSNLHTEPKFFWFDSSTKPKTARSHSRADAPMRDRRNAPVPIMLSPTDAYLSEGLIRFRAVIMDVPPSTMHHFRSARSPLFSKYSFNFVDSLQPVVKSYCLSATEPGTYVRQEDPPPTLTTLSATVLAHGHMTYVRGEQRTTPDRLSAVLNLALGNDPAAGGPRTVTWQATRFPDPGGPSNPTLVVARDRDVIVCTRGDLVQDYRKTMERLAVRYREIAERVPQASRELGLAGVLSCDFVSDFELQADFEATGVLMSEEARLAVSRNAVLRRTRTWLRGAHL